MPETQTVIQTATRRTIRHTPRSMQELEAKTLDLEDVGRITGMQRQTLKHYLAKRLIQGTAFSVADAVEICCINDVGRCGAGLPLGKLAGVPVLKRLKQRLDQRLLGTDNRLAVMVFSWRKLKSSGRGMRIGHTQIDATFIQPADLDRHFSEKLALDDGVVLSVYQADAVLEAIIKRYYAA